MRNYVKVDHEAILIKLLDHFFIYKKTGEVHWGVSEDVSLAEVDPELNEVMSYLLKEHRKEL